MDLVLRLVCFIFFTLLNAQTRFAFEHQQMGTQIKLVFYAEDSLQADSVSKAAFHRIDELNNILSDYIEDSELNTLCSKAGEVVQVCDELYTVLQMANEISKVTNGAFDITAAPVIRLWRTARQLKLLPSERELEPA
ncbi:MAG: FAD:protein FMN transferase, partial [Flavobacteriaceae bacterium]